jgi:NADH dehydrogenase FAD-containing subunit
LVPPNYIILEKEGFSLISGRKVIKIEKNKMTLDNDETYDFDLLFWSTGASPPEIFKNSGLDTCKNGYLLVNKFLQSVSDEDVFGMGDCITIKECPISKAGVYSVREGPIMIKNVRMAIVDEKKFVEYDPQHDFLKIINTGDNKGIGMIINFLC